MTIILEQPKPSQPFLLFKHNKQLRVGDKIIFQQLKVDAQMVGGIVVEETVSITYVYEGPGIYAGYQLVTWEDNS